MATATRVYVIRNKTGGAARLVEATHPSHALRHVAESQLSVDVAGQHDLVSLISAGVRVEKINQEQQELG